MPDSKTRVLGYTRALGKGGVAYIALGHCPSPEMMCSRLWTPA